MDLIKCALCNEKVPLESVQSHRCKRSPGKGGSDSPLVEYPEDFEEQLRVLYNAPGGLMMESVESHKLLSLGSSTLYKLSHPNGKQAGWVSKRGTSFYMYDLSEDPKLLKSIKGRLIERKEAAAPEFQEEEQLSLLCKVCGSKIPVDLVEKHAKTCAISFPVQIIRFEHSAEAEPDKKTVAAKQDDAVVVNTINDFPQTVLTALDKSGVPKEMYARNLDVLVNVLNFASKMKFRVAENRESELRTAANDALKADFSQQSMQELCKVAHHLGSFKEMQLARDIVRTVEEGLCLLHQKPSVPAKAADEAMPKESEGHRIIAAQKQLMEEASKLYTEHTDRTVKRMYAFRNKIGEGGYGKVYNARCKDKNMPPEEVAIKIMEHSSTDVKSRRSNLRELLYLARLQHPNIVRLYRAHLVDKHSLWLVLEFMEGGTLREASKAQKFDEDEVAFAACEILKGVAFMHAQGCVHRDIKSHNVMMTVRGEVKLIDLGLVADVKKGISTMRGILGTTFWIPPEMIRGEQHSYPADVWSLGICLLELCHGHPPNRDNKLRALFLAGAGVAPGLEDPSKWTDACADFFSCCLVPDQRERYSAQQLLEHKWLHSKADVSKMTRRLQAIFLNSALTNAGFL